MQNIRKPESIHPTRQNRSCTEPLSTNQRDQPERLYEGPIVPKPINPQPKVRDAYVSDMVNVHSLLNIRALQSTRRKRNDSKSFQDRIIINICGDRYETHRTTLELYPETLLGNPKLRRYYFDKTRNEYFFDRNRACFEAILYFYQSHGRLRRPNFVSLDIFLEEVTFFQLGQEALNQLREDENIKEVKKIILPKSRWRRHLWATIEYPDYSQLAKLVRILSLLMILVSTLALAIESLPQYEITMRLDCNSSHGVVNGSINASKNDSNATIQYLPGDVYLCHGYFLSTFFIIQTICVAFFTLELLLRIISAPAFFGFIKNLMNWIDIVSIVPYYISLGIYVSGRENSFNSTAYIALRLLRILRFARVLKFYRIFKHIKSLRVLVSTMKESVPDFLLMVTILTLLSFLFGAAAYFAEHDTNGQAFDSIFKATYWGIITITSVGYGDIAPITPIGRIITCLCALLGAAMIGMLVSVLVDRYQRVFARKLYKKEEIIDFDDYSDEENNDSDSRSGGSGQLRRRNVKEIEDPDARAKINAAFASDPPEDTDLTQIPTVLAIDENSISRKTSRIHFIIGYVDDQNHQTASTLLETISSIIVDRQTLDENIQLNIISSDHTQDKSSSPVNVQFDMPTSSDDDDEEFTEIGFGRRSKGNVLKTFQCPPSPENKKSFE